MPVYAYRDGSGVSLSINSQPASYEVPRTLLSAWATNYIGGTWSDPITRKLVPSELFVNALQEALACKESNAYYGQTNKRLVQLAEQYFAEHFTDLESEVA